MFNALFDSGGIAEILLWFNAAFGIAILLEYTPGWHSCTGVQWRLVPLAVGLEPFRHKDIKTYVIDLLNDVLLPWGGTDGFIDWRVWVVPCPLRCNMHELLRRNVLFFKNTVVHVVWVCVGQYWMTWLERHADGRQSPASHISSSLKNNHRAQEQRQPGGDGSSGSRWFERNAVYQRHGPPSASARKQLWHAPDGHRWQQRTLLSLLFLNRG